MDTFLSWQTLTTHAGVTLATGVVTQFLKEFGVLKKLPTRLLSYIIAVLLLLLATAFTSGLTLSRALLCPINAIGVSLASNGGFDAIVKVGSLASDKNKTGADK